ncbi:serine/threonine-protein kinase haspin [Pimephales promelas]|nr:serine/threonine-protein kinase haspin [Pimephales promelas]
MFLRSAITEVLPDLPEMTKDILEETLQSLGQTPESSSSSVDATPRPPSTFESLSRSSQSTSSNHSQSPNPDWVDTFLVPWDKLPEELMQLLERGNRPSPRIRREMVRIVVQEMMRKNPCPSKKSSTEVAKKMVVKYPKSLQDIIEGDVIGPGYHSLLAWQSISKNLPELDLKKLTRNVDLKGKRLLNYFNTVGVNRNKKFLQAVTNLRVIRGELSGCSEDVKEMLLLLLSYFNKKEDAMLCYVEDTCLAEEVQMDQTSCDEHISIADRIYRECQQSGPLRFFECVPPAGMKHCLKIGEGTFAEVFSISNGSNEAIALKIIPVEGSHRVNGQHQKTFREILHEIIISKELSRLKLKETNKTDGFIGLNNVHCVRGRYPDAMVKAWDRFCRRQGSKNVRPVIDAEGWTANHPRPEDIMAKWRPLSRAQAESDPGIIKGVTRQKWSGLAVKDFGEQKGVVATKAFGKGSILCDFHGKVITGAEGREMAETQASWATCFSSNMALTKSASMRRLSPGGDRHVLLFQATTDIKKDDKICFDHGIKKRTFRGEEEELEWLNI